jgi:hypothetical protein
LQGQTLITGKFYLDKETELSWHFILTWITDSFYVIGDDLVLLLSFKTGKCHALSSAVCIRTVPVNSVRKSLSPEMNIRDYAANSKVANRLTVSVEKQ